MAFLLPILTKIAWWLFPKLIGSVMDWFGRLIELVEQAENIEDPAARRDAVLSKLWGTGVIPESLLRGAIEFAVILIRLGVTSQAMSAMENLVTVANMQALSDVGKRVNVLSQFAALFPDMPERIGRLLLEIAVARITSVGAGLKPALTPANTTGGYQPSGPPLDVTNPPTGGSGMPNTVPPLCCGAPAEGAACSAPTGTDPTDTPKGAA